MSLVRRVRSGLRPRQLWSVAVHAENVDYELGESLSRPILLLSEKRLFRRADDILHRADPFLIEEGGELFLFMEVAPASGKGRIEAWKTADLRTFECLGDVLAEPHHLSYPFLFRHRGTIFMIPETCEADGVFLYAFDAFPRGLRRVRKLLSGYFVDSSLTCRDGMWYLATESRRGMELYVAPDPVEGVFQPHPMNPITTDKVFSRGGGGFMDWKGALVRMAQDCSATYGANLNAMRVETLSPQDYAESVLCRDLFSRSDPWNRRGAHHLSIMPFNGKLVIAVDGLRDDHYTHRIPEFGRRLRSRMWTTGS